MSDEFLYDEHGQVYERSWNGNYEQKWDFWSQQPVRESCQRDRNPSDHLDDGTPLYRGYTTSNEISSSGSDGLLELLVSLLVMAFIALAIPLIKLFINKIIAPMIKYLLESIQEFFNVWITERREFRMLSIAVMVGILNMILMFISGKFGGFLVIGGMLGIIHVYLVVSTMKEIKKSH